MAASTQTETWLVVKLADIGDLLTITPALARLRELRPGAAVHVLATAHSAPVLAGTGLADDVIPFDKFAFDHVRDALRPGSVAQAVSLARRLRGAHYDGVLILHHLTTRFGAAKYAGLALATGSRRRAGLDNGRGWFLTTRIPDGGFGVQHEAAYWLNVVDAALGVDDPAAYTPTRYPLRAGSTPADHTWAERTLPPADGPRVVIHTGSGGYSPARRWPPGGFAQVADALITHHNAQVIFVGGKDDNTDAAINAMSQTPLNLAGRTTLGQLCAVLGSADIFIGADSGVMHLAAASGTRVLALFGPSNAAAWGPWLPPERATVLRSAPLCSPCSYVLSTVGQREGCPARTCMRMITPQHVISAAVDLLDGASTSPESAPFPRRDDRLRLLGVPLDAITWDDLRERLADWVESGEPHQLCTVNPEFIMVAQGDLHFYEILNRADLCAADGVGLLLAARALGRPLPDRITGSDGLPKIAAWAAEAGWRLFLLGAAEGVADQAAAILQARHPGLQIAGVYAGSPAPEDEDAIVERINRSGADLLFVAYGAPRQDKWIARNLPRLKVKAAMGVGGAIDFVAGVQQRAPAGWQRLGLEWLYRLIKEPWRWRRMLRLPRFVLAVLRRGSRGPLHFVGPRRKRDA